MKHVARNHSSDKRVSDCKGLASRLTSRGCHCRVTARKPVITRVNDRSRLERCKQRVTSVVDISRVPQGIGTLYRGVKGGLWPLTSQPGGLTPMITITAMHIQQRSLDKSEKKRISNSGVTMDAAGIATPWSLGKHNTMSAILVKKAKSKYRNRIRLERTSQKQSSDTHKTPYDRVKRCRERKINIKASDNGPKRRSDVRPTLTNRGRRTSKSVVIIALQAANSGTEDHFRSNSDKETTSKNTAFRATEDLTDRDPSLPQIHYVTVCTSRTYTLGVPSMVEPQLFGHDQDDSSASNEQEENSLSGVSMEQRRNARVEETGNPRGNPPTRGIVRHYSHVRKFRSDAAGNRIWFAYVGGK
ncbi:hypothetical protein PR048_002884 [Dryococelus australis]|uniref:Uncharacterized protein n=1 Tax=Dryococelus australis TaxID=614101 RepID=A0ABQ9ILJ8_9NEOP|nr:hypothetical protein PR048_002884 [Dryococelus australis]